VCGALIAQFQGFADVGMGIGMINLAMALERGSRSSRGSRVQS
jgi:hypothetical protein